jgi:O-antigen/teichoic acid export membrane protein
MSVIRKQTILNTLFSYFGVFIGTITQAYVVPNYLSTEQNGILQLLMSYMFIVAQIASLGFNNAGNRFFTFFRDPEKSHKGYLNLGLKFTALGVAISYLALFLLKSTLVKNAGEKSNLFENYYWLIYPISLATVLFNLFDNFLKSNYQTVWGTFLSQFLQRFLIFLSLFLIIFKITDFENFTIFWAIGLSIPTLLIVFQAFSTPGGNLKSESFFKNWNKKQEFFTFSMISTLTGISTLIIAHLDKILIYRYLGLSMTGIYGTVSLFGSVMGMSYMAVVKASAAIVIDSINTHDIPKLERIYKKSALTQFAFGCLVIIGVYFSIDHLFHFIKPQYEVGKNALLLIGFAKLIDLSNGINGLILSNSKYYKIDTILVITFVGLLLILNNLLIPNYGLNGAGLAVLISMVYYNFTRTLVVYIVFGIHPFSKKQFLVGVLALSLLLIGWLFGREIVFFQNHFISLTFKSVGILVLFILFILVLKIVPELNKLWIKYIKN